MSELMQKTDYHMRQHIISAVYLFIPQSSIYKQKQSFKCSSTQPELMLRTYLFSMLNQSSVKIHREINVGAAEFVYSFILVMLCEVLPVQ